MATLRAPEYDGFRPTPLRTYAGVLARRKRLFLAVLVVVPLAAVAISLQGQSLYQGTAQVLLSERDLASALSGGQSGGTNDLDRVATTQASIARTPDLARRVLRTANLGAKSADDLLDASDVSPVRGTNVLEFSVVDPDPDLAARLASAYAQQFVQYTRAIDTAAIERARRGVLTEMARLARQDARGSDLYARLAEQAQTLRTMAALQTSRAQLLRIAEDADKVEPRPTRAAAFGFVVALLLGIGLVALLEALDTRVRSEADVEDGLGVALLGRISEPPRRLRRSSELAVLKEPDGADAEAFRILRANIEYANSKLGARTIMLTSSVRGEGKSTTAANIAASFARLGKRVALVDLDFRRPTVHSGFQLQGSLGVSDVVLGRVPLEEALAKVPIAPRSSNSSRSSRRWGAGAASRRRDATMPADSPAVLEVLPTGTTPSNIGEFVGAGGVSDVLRALSDRFEIVFIDAPPVLEVSDPITLMTEVDAIVLVARLGVVRYPMLKELRRILDATAIATLGVVVTGAEPTEGYGPYRDYGAQPVPTTEQTAAPAGLHVVDEGSRHRSTLP